MNNEREHALAKSSCMELADLELTICAVEQYSNLIYMRCWGYVSLNEWQAPDSGTVNLLTININVLP